MGYLLRRADRLTTSVDRCMQHMLTSRDNGANLRFFGWCERPNPNANLCLLIAMKLEKDRINNIACDKKTIFSKIVKMEEVRVRIII